MESMDDQTVVAHVGEIKEIFLLRFSPKFVNLIKNVAAKIHGDHQQVKNSNQFDKCNQNTHFFRFLSLIQRSISRWQTPTQGLP